MSFARTPTPSWTIRLLKLLSGPCTMVLIRFYHKEQRVEIVHSDRASPREVIEAAQMALADVRDKVTR